MPKMGFDFLTIHKLGFIMPNMGTYTDALFSKTQQRVLAVLFGQPQRSFYANEIIALAGGGSGAVQRELAKLADAGLIKSQRIGNQNIIRPMPMRRFMPSYAVLWSKPLDSLTLYVWPLVDIWPQIELALVYGSVAKGNEHAAASDIDLMVVGEQISHAQLLAALLPAQQTLGRPINPTNALHCCGIHPARDGRTIVYSPRAGAAENFCKGE
ncbi:nucleotidyltransferase domain-containing protein [Deefgea sp. CFH1-16]|uniref:nucleotidyltransferase domain-containing protein n=1 Tax=Deefgea sp. CFH1-16 TaxID=2675457 RepID=UPI0019402AF5|nr:nucleotidyltransferase domain-containing protein [Deefgea sp. CFH1-16]